LAVGHDDRLTAEQVHNVAFSKPPLLARGYNEDEVDAFLERVEAVLRHSTALGGVSPADLHNVAFSRPPAGRRGYNKAEVDPFVDRVQIELTRRPPGRGNC
jgi:DivIVA domain-containing protein